MQLHSFSIRGALAIVAAWACSGGDSNRTGPSPVARELVFSSPPGAILAGGRFGPAIAVEIRDTDGTVVTASSATVTLSLAPGGGPGALSGTAVAAAFRGAASFPTLSVDEPGTYGLVATASGLDSAVSAPFVVAPLPMTATIDVGTPGGAIQFRSVRNGSLNPAVDTIASGGTVTWVWRGSNHSVNATDGNFLESGTQNAPSQWVVNFIIPQTYRFDCFVHGTAMSGAIVVQ